MLIMFPTMWNFKRCKSNLSFIYTSYSLIANNPSTSTHKTFPNLLHLNRLFLMHKECRKLHNILHLSRKYICNNLETYLAVNVQSAMKKLPWFYC